MKIDLRAPLPEDYDFCRRLHHETMKPLCLEYFEWIDGEQDARFQKNYAPEEVKIIYTDGQRAGWLQIQEDKSIVNLGEIHVDNAFQGKGIGTFVLQHLVDQARISKKAMTLSVMKNNRAKNLYERIGFIVANDSEIKYGMHHKDTPLPYKPAWWQ